MAVAEAQAQEQTAIEAATQEVAWLYEAEQSWSAQYLDTRAHLARLEADSGAAVLDGSDPRKLAIQIGNLHDQLRVAASAIAEARRRRLEAIPRIWQAEAQQLREKAAQLRAEADERQIRTSKLLAELQAWEGCPYEPSREPQRHPLEYQPLKLDRRATTEGPALPATTAPWFAGLEERVVPTPKTQIMRNEAETLENRAQQIESQVVIAAGRIDAGTRDELLQDLHAYGPMQLVPARHKVLAWLDAGEQHASQWETLLARHQVVEVDPDDRRISRVSYREEHAQVRYVLSWRDGQIDERESAIGPSRE